MSVVRVQYGTGTTEPTVWYLAGIAEVDGTVCTPPFPSGTTVWIRKRVERLGFLPSAWTYDDPVVVGPAAPVLYSLSIVIDEIYDVPRIIWTRNSLALGVRIDYEFHDPSASPTYTSSVDVDATLGEFSLLGEPLFPGEKLSVRVTPYTGYSGGAVNGTAGTPLYASRNG